MGAATSLTTAEQQSTTTRAVRLVLQMGEPVELEQYRVLALLLVLSQLTQIARRNIL